MFYHSNDIRSFARATTPTHPTAHALRRRSRRDNTHTIPFTTAFASFVAVRAVSPTISGHVLKYVMHCYSHFSKNSGQSLFWRIALTSQPAPSVRLHRLKTSLRTFFIIRKYITRRKTPVGFLVNHSCWQRLHMYIFSDASVPCADTHTHIIYIFILIRKSSLL